MTDDRVTRIRAAYDAYNRGDFEAVIEVFHEDVEWHPPATSVEPQPLHGRQAVRDYLTPNLFDRQLAEPLEIIDEGDRILVMARSTMRGAGSGLVVEETVFHLWSIDDELVVGFEVFNDRDEALRALRS
jgi:ketosteroid isomerase-like protein